MRFDGVVRGMEQIIHPEEQHEVRIGKGRMAGLGRFGHVPGVEPALQRSRKLFRQIVLGENPLDIGNGSGIGERRGPKRAPLLFPRGTSVTARVIFCAQPRRRAPGARL